MNKKICVIGAGNWGFNHIKTLASMDCLGGVIEINDKNKNKVKNFFPDVPIISNLQDSLRYSFDGYIISTPVTTHYKIAKKIIENKFNVLIEKPMTLNSFEAKQIVDLAKLNGVKVMVGHVLLFHPAIQKMKKIINSGTLGNLQYIYSNRLNLGKVRTEENVFWSFAPHDISILQYFTDSFPDNVETTGGAFLQNNVFDTTITTLSYPNNVKAHIYLSWLHPFKEHRIVVIGSKGMLSFEDSKESKPLKFYDKKYVIKDSIPEKHEGEVELIDYPKQAPLEQELKYFINSRIDKLTISNAQNGLDVIKILESSSNYKQIN